MTLEEAENLLSRIPEYNWLTKDGTDWYKAEELATHLGIGEHAVRARCKDGSIHGATFYGEKIGWRIPRSGVILYLASIVSSQGQ
jgi:hypothetical protein